MKVFYVVNPASRAGRTRRLWYENLKKAECYTPDMRWFFTEGPLHAVEIARNAADNGYGKIVSVGGDGTLNEVVNGIMQSSKRDKVLLGVISLGTGSDFIKTLGIPQNVDEMFNSVARGKPLKIDVGICRFTDHSGKNSERYFLNIADAGIGGETVAKVNSTTKIFGGFASFLYGTLSTLIFYKNKKVKYTIDSETAEEMITMLVVANGRFFGGGMQIAPEAELNDEYFDVIVVKEAGLLDFLKYGTFIYRGVKITGDDRVRYIRAKRVTASSEEEVLIDVDGEQPGRLPASFEIISSAISVIGYAENGEEVCEG